MRSAAGSRTGPTTGGRHPGPAQPRLGEVLVATCRGQPAQHDRGRALSVLGRRLPGGGVAPVKVSVEVRPLLSISRIHIGRRRCFIRPVYSLISGFDQNGNTARGWGVLPDETI